MKRSNGIKTGRAIHVTKIQKTMWTFEIQRRAVQVMAVFGNYAMVRRNGCYPYVADVRELEQKPKNEPPASKAADHQRQEERSPDTGRDASGE